jgi:hypothetical protein
MLNQHSLEEIGDIHNLLEDIKKEYNEGIKPILIKIVLRDLRILIQFQN